MHLLCVGEDLDVINPGMFHLEMQIIHFDISFFFKKTYKLQMFFWQVVGGRGVKYCMIINQKYIISIA